MPQGLQGAAGVAGGLGLSAAAPAAAPRLHGSLAPQLSPAACGEFQRSRLKCQRPRARRRGSSVLLFQGRVRLSHQLSWWDQRDLGCETLNLSGELGCVV